MNRLSIALLLLVGGISAFAEEPAPRSHPADSWELTLESGYLWQVGDNTNLDYEILPTQLTFRTPAHWTWWENEAGARLLVRGRISVLFASMVEGPESYYLGVAGAPSVEYWCPNERTSFFFSVGGGAGLTDSTGVPGGQGQDFTLNWFAQAGLRQSLTEELSIVGGAYFLHLSNGGQTSPNPGIDALGIALGLAYRF